MARKSSKRHERRHVEHRHHKAHRGGKKSGGLAQGLNSAFKNPGIKLGGY